MENAPIENGAVALSGNRIVEVGQFPTIAARNPVREIIDLGDCALLPGLINAHCHLDYTALRHKIPRQTSFTEWIRSINLEKAKLSPEDYINSINQGFAQAKRFGTTTIANLTAFPELISRVSPPIRTWWFPELIDIRKPNRADEVVGLAVQEARSGTGRLPLTAWGLAPHALFTASADLFARCEEVARDQGVLLTTHLAESDEEFSMFREASGPLYDFLKEIGRDMSDCGRGTPLATFVAGRDDGTLQNWIITHLNELAASDFKLLPETIATPHHPSPVRFAIVHCPRSHKYFGHSPFQFERLRKCGFWICLGTDSLASNDDLSVLAEMRQFQRNFPAVSPDKILAMGTINPARALGQQSFLGVIRSGAFADLVAVPLASASQVFEQIIAFEGSVSWSMCNGMAD